VKGRTRIYMIRNEPFLGISDHENISVYLPDTLTCFAHMRNRVDDRGQGSRAISTGLRKITYEEPTPPQLLLGHPACGIYALGDARKNDSPYRYFLAPYRLFDCWSECSLRWSPQLQVAETSGFCTTEQRITVSPDEE
jgi:hypothetical protein